MKQLIVKLLEPKTEKLLLELESLNLISVVDPGEGLGLEYLEPPITMQEIVDEVKIVRAEMYAQKQATHNYHWYKFMD